jgi:hypothetical protein
MLGSEPILEFMTGFESAPFGSQVRFSLYQQLAIHGSDRRRSLRVRLGDRRARDFGLAPSGSTLGYFIDGHGVPPFSLVILLN